MSTTLTTLDIFTVTQFSSYVYAFLSPFKDNFVHVMSNDYFIVKKPLVNSWNLTKGG